MLFCALGSSPATLQGYPALGHSGLLSVYLVKTFKGSKSGSWKSGVQDDMT